MKKKRRAIRSHREFRNHRRFKNIFLLIVILVALFIASYTITVYNLDSRSKAQSDRSIKLGTFTPLLYPTVAPNIVLTVAPTGLITGGPVAPSAPFYCIDDEDPEGCDDNTAFWVPKGVDGIAGTCGSVIEQGHKIVSSLPQGLKDFRDSVNPSINNCGYSTGTYSSGYISTFFVIDAYNLAGLTGLSKLNASQVTGDGMLNWWQSGDAITKGFRYIPYSPTVISQHATGKQNLTGCVMFLRVPSGIHVGVVNYLELVDSYGDGVISILQSGAPYFLDRFEVVGWDIKNTPLHQTVIDSVAGFGCHI